MGGVAVGAEGGGVAIAAGQAVPGNGGHYLTSLILSKSKKITTSHYNNSLNSLNLIRASPKFNDNKLSPNSRRIEENLIYIIL